MRLLGNMRRGRIRFAPMPLEICPGRQIWEKHRNREYLVFVDESFYRFFGFDAMDGNFCHAALGVPVDNYARLQGLLEPVLQAYNRQVHHASGVIPREIKFTVLRTLPLQFRLRFTRELVSALIETGGFVSGFYTPTQGMIMERVRVNLLDERDEVPEDHAALYSVAQAELLAQFRGVGQSELITLLLTLPFAAVTNFLKSFDCVFRVRYDPRQEEEDQIVRASIADYMDRLMRLPDPFGHTGIYLGMESDIRSHDDVGLQLADVFAGEVRDFFRNNPESLTEAATPTLIKPGSDEPLQHFEEAENRIFKTGVLSPMSRGLARKLIRKNRATVLSYYYPVLAAGMLTCITGMGQERHLELPTRMIFDLLD
jgi:hypothetical protein